MRSASSFLMVYTMVSSLSFELRPIITHRASLAESSSSRARAKDLVRRSDRAQRNPTGQRRQLRARPAAVLRGTAMPVHRHPCAGRDGYTTSLACSIRVGFRLRLYPQAGHWFQSRPSVELMAHAMRESSDEDGHHPAVTCNSRTEAGR